MLAGTRGFDRGVQSKQIGLPGDLLHDRDFFGNGLHRFDGTADRGTTGFGILRRLCCDLLGLAGVLGILLHI